MLARRQVVSRYTTSGGGSERFPGDPGVGSMYYGQSIEGWDVSGRETYYGHIVGAHRSYYQNGLISGLLSDAAADLAAGRLPIISTKLPPGETWQSVANNTNGTDASWLQPLFNGLGALSGPIWLCFHHEPYDDTNGSTMTAETYTAMYRHIYPMKSSNVAIVPILQSAPFDPSVFGHQDITPWFDTSACDQVGLDSYNHWYAPDGNRWRDPEEIIDFFTTVNQIFDLPIAWCEYGVRTDPSNPGKAAAWMAAARSQAIATNFITAMSYFDSSQNVNDGGTPWTLSYSGDGTDGTERLAEFKTLLNSNDGYNYFLP